MLSPTNYNIGGLAKTGEGKRIVGALEALERLGHVAGDAGGYQLRKVA
ncbi:hypothetical protein OSJ57_24355 [Sphingomonas sp. HH69]